MRTSRRLACARALWTRKLKLTLTLTSSLALIAATALVGARARGEAAAAHGPSPLIYPQQTIPLQFDHAAHRARGTSCETCHADALTSTAAADNLMPGEAACRPCHAIDRAQPFQVTAPRPAARCDACHTGWTGAGPGAGPPRVVVPRPNLKFNHRLHALRGVGCEVCHAQVGQVALATEADLPRMALCLGCHGGGAKQPTARCGACHLTLPDGRLKVNLAVGGPLSAAITGQLVPSGSLRGFDAHTSNFRTDHKAAGRDESYCLNCHRRSECLDCHNGVVRPLDIHPSDYVTLHGPDARRNTPDCSSCHRNQTFCVGCHQRTGVAADPSGGLPGRPVQNPFGTGTGVKQFHPADWARDATGNVLTAPRPGSHSLQAKRNIRGCVSCHREETCIECHSADPTRSVNVTPHGIGFAESAKCRALATRNRRACLKCHGVGAVELDCR
jgi:Cytochrome c7 and related cytochrome c